MPVMRCLPDWGIVFLEDGSCEQVLQAIAECSWSRDAGEHSQQLSRLLEGIARQQGAQSPDSLLKQNNEAIESVMEEPDPGAVLRRIGQHSGKWWQQAYDFLKQGCPVTAGMVVEQFDRTRTLSLAEVFRLEMNMAVQCLRHKNFAEGVRALLLEPESAPRWMPATLEEVTEGDVSSYFVSPWDEGEHPLRDLEDIG